MEEPIECKKPRLQHDSCEKQFKCGDDGYAKCQVEGNKDNAEPKSGEPRHQLGGQRKDSIIREENVGISEYLNPRANGMEGILKQRYSDFIVTERNSNGTLIKLTTFEIPDEKEEMESAGNKRLVEYQFLDSSYKDLIEKVYFDQIVELSIKGGNQEILLPPEENKASRKMLHTFIKENFSTLDSDTTEDNNHAKRIRIFGKNQKSSTRKPHFKTPRWPDSLPKYCHFTLYKENMDTMDAVNLLAKFLGVKPSLFTYAGTKDRRAITVQRLCAYTVKASKLKRLNKLIKNCVLGNFEYKDVPLQLGDHSGNHFSITLRNIQLSAEELRIALGSFSQYGFINYFGMQRFGTGSASTHVIGKSLLCSEWKEAVNLILKPRIGGSTFQQAAKECWFTTKDPEQAWKKLTNKRCLEGHLLQGLIKVGKTNYLDAILQIPRNTRMMYVHAFQSLIWNLVVSKRFKELGSNVIAGDLVYIVDNMEECTTEVSGNAKFDGTKTSKKKAPLKHLSAEDVESKRYTIFDVIMPLPGYDVEYPKNFTKDWYNVFMTEHGIDINNMRHRIKDFSLSGAYRNIAVKPMHLTWKRLQYDDYTIPLFSTDLDKMQGKEEQAGENSGALAALCLEFTLPSSSYATMAIRELTKMESFYYSRPEVSCVEDENGD